MKKLDEAISDAKEKHSQSIVLCGFVGPEGAEILSSALEYMPFVSQVFLSGSSLGDLGASVFAGLVLRCSSLTHLSLPSCEVGDEGAASIAEAVAQNKTLCLLDLSSNPISDFGARALSRALLTNSSLHTLSLSYTRIGSDGFSLIARSLEKNTALEILNLWGNFVDEAPFNRALQTNKSLTTLFTSHFPSAGLAEILERNKRMPKESAMAFCRALHERLGGNSPASSLVGFTHLTKFIVFHALPSWKNPEDRKPVD